MLSDRAEVNRRRATDVSVCPVEQVPDLGRCLSVRGSCGVREERRQNIADNALLLDTCAQAYDPDGPFALPEPPPEPGPTSYAQFAPIEVAPFHVRCEFRWVQDEDGRDCRIPVAGPSLVEPPVRDVFYAITADHQRTLEENARRYKRIAECLVEVDIDGATKVRAAMLETARRRQPRERITDLYLVDLGSEFSDRVDEYRRNRDNNALMDELASKRGVQRFQLRRQLKVADDKGFVPCGYPPRS